MLVHEPWTAVGGLVHGFLDAAACAGHADLGTALAACGVALPLCTARQVHGTAVIVPGVGEPRREADALLAVASGVAVGVVTADCAPVLLVAPRHQAAAAAHAGWRGAATGVLEAAVAALRARAGASAEIEAVIGPAIGGCCYQVGHEVHEAFRSRVGALTAAAWSPDGERLRLDLRTAVRALLHAVGVERVTVLGPCTFCGEGYSSYRRDGAGAGRQLSWVGWMRR